jgi:hypothetical protein
MWKDGDSERIPIGDFIMSRFFAGKNLAECFFDFEKVYGKYSFDPRKSFDRMEVAAKIRRYWYEFRKINRLPPGVSGVSLDDLLKENKAPALRG